MKIIIDAIDVCGKRFYNLAVEELARTPDEERIYQFEIVRDTFDHMYKKIVNLITKVTRLTR